MNDRYDPLQKGLDDLSTDPVEHGHFTRTMAEVRTRLEGRSTMKNVFKKSALIGGFTIATILAMLLIPVTYNLRVGTLIKAEFALSDDVSPQKVVEATASITSGRKMLRFDDNGVLMTLATKLGDTKMLQEELQKTLQASFPAITSVKFSTEPIVERHGGNALAAVTGGRIEIGCEGLSDAEIEAAIAQALASHGVNVQQVSVSTTSPGEGQIERRIEIRADCDSTVSGESLPEIELNLSDDIQGGERHQERVIVKDERP